MALRVSAWLLGTTLVLVVGCTGSGEGKTTGQGGPPPVFAETETLSSEAIRDVIPLLGQLEAEESVRLRSEIEGVVREILFEEGQRVSDGDVLFRLDDARQRALLAEAKARERLAADVHARRKKLAARSVAAEAELVRAALELDVANAEVSRAQVELAKTVLRAPFDGTVGLRSVSPGARVDRETELATVHATDRLRVVFTLPERALSLVREGMPLEVTVSEFPGESFPAEVYFVGPALNPTTRRVPVKGNLSNPGRRLRPGTFANVTVEIERHEKTLVVPDTAVVYDAEGTFAWRLGKEGRAERVAIELGIRQDGRVEVRSGLNPGDRIVVSGTNKVFPGATVAPPPGEKPAAPPSTS